MCDCVSVRLKGRESENQRRESEGERKEVAARVKQASEAMLRLYERAVAR